MMHYGRKKKLLGEPDSSQPQRLLRKGWKLKLQCYIYRLLLLRISVFWRRIIRRPYFQPCVDFNKANEFD